MGTQNVHHKLVPKGSSVAEDDRIGTKGKNLQWNTAGTALCVKQGIGGRAFENVSQLDHTRVTKGAVRIQSTTN